MPVNLRDLLPDKQCLIIDDQVDSRSLVKKFLMKYGATEIDTANDGDDATRKIADKRYDLIIADFNLGKGKDGQQVLEESRHTSRLLATSCFIILSAENASDVVLGALDNSADDFISKPFNFGTLETRISRTLAVKEMLKGIEENIDRNQHDEAIKLCEELLKRKNPIKLKLLRILAKELLKTKRFSQAQKIYQKIMDIKPMNWASLGLATCEYHLGKLDRAAYMLEDTIKQYPLYAQAYDLLAKIYSKKEKYGEAVDYLVKAAKKSPRSVLRQMDLGKLAYERGYFKIAEQAYQQALAMGKYSCYVDVATFKNYVKTLQQKIVDENTRESNNATADALKATAAMKLRFQNEEGVGFDAEVLDAGTFVRRGHSEQAENSANNAENIIADSAKATNEQRIALLETFVETKQVEKAEALITRLEKLDSLTPNEIHRFKKAKSSHSAYVNRKSPEELHEEAIACYKKKEFRKAMDIFDDVAKSKDAGESALLNAIQAKLAVMEDEGFDDQLMKETTKLVHRIGWLPRKNPRYDRLNELKKRYDKLDSKKS